jgi:hypothetical protein
MYKCDTSQPYHVRAKKSGETAPLNAAVCNFQLEKILTQCSGSGFGIPDPVFFGPLDPVSGISFFRIPDPGSSPYF